MNFQIVACANARPSIDYLQRGFDAFMQSSRRFGHEPLLLGWGEKWGGLGTKPRMFKRAIQNGLIKGERILFCDAFDVAFLSDPADIPSTGLLFNGERSCFPDASLAPRFDAMNPVSSFRYLNSGVSVGTPKEYLAALNEMRAEDIPDDYWMARGDKRVRVEPNDQLYWQQLAVSGRLPISIDSACEFFQTTHALNAGDVEFSDGKLKNNETNTMPIVVHANGDKNAALWLSVCEWVSKQ